MRPWGSSQTWKYRGKADAPTPLGEASLQWSPQYPRRSRPSEEKASRSIGERSSSIGETGIAGEALAAGGALLEAPGGPGGAARPSPQPAARRQRTAARARIRRRSLNA